MKNAHITLAALALCAAGWSHAEMVGNQMSPDAMDSGSAPIAAPMHDSAMPHEQAEGRDTYSPAAVSSGSATASGEALTRAEVRSGAHDAARDQQRRAAESYLPNEK